VRIGPKLDLVLAVGRARPRPADRDTAAAERDLAGLMAMAHRRPVGNVPALRADDLVDLGVHQLVQHAEPDADAERHQSFPCRARQLAQRLQHRLGQSLDALAVGRDRRGPIRSSCGWSSLSSWTWFAPSRSQPDRTGREDRRLKFYELRDNLSVRA
jgi:hypothetical protein